MLGLVGWVLSSVSAKRITIDNVSPMIEYKPSLVGPMIFEDSGDMRYVANSAPTAWNTSFPDVAYRPWDLRNITEKHFTWASSKAGSEPPSLKITFVGTGITMFGPDSKPKKTVAPGSVELRVDDDDQYSKYCKEDNDDDSRMACDVGNLPFGRHSATVTIQTGSFAIGHFEIETGKEE